MTFVVETLCRPGAYSHAQVKRACLLAAAIDRGTFLLTEKPALCPQCFDQPETFCVSCGAIAKD